ncbi:MAG: ABC transporter substrate-binding protein [Deltaproteobacteria bacterium]|nr:ABC transporter substrate-binding protein [Deltaproteobacteria bacterium]
MAEPIFTITPPVESSGFMTVTDALGRRLTLVPRDQTPPAGLLPSQIIFTPVRRTAGLSGNYDLGIMKALGVLDTLVGVVDSDDDSVSREILTALPPEAEKPVFLGHWDAPDYEKVKTLKPDLILGGTLRGLDIFEAMECPAVFTYSHEANGLEDRLRFIEFLAVLYDRRPKAKSIALNIRRVLAELKASLPAGPGPKVLYGDFWADKPMVHPANHWTAQILSAVGGRLVFPEVTGSRDFSVSLEEFYLRGQEADIFLPTLSVIYGFTTKQELLLAHPLLNRFKSMKPGGRVYMTLQKMYVETGEIAALARDLAYIVNPDLHPGHRLTYLKFMP